MSYESYRVQVGAFDVLAVADGAIQYPVDAVFAAAPRPEVDVALAQRGLSTVQLTVPYTCLLIDTGEHKVLVDTGAGHLADHAAGIFPGLDHSTSTSGHLTASLKAAGVNPGDIDTVIITHGHPDHLGGTVDDNGQLQFPNARYFMSRAEWEFWMSPNAEATMMPAMVHIARHNLDPIEDRVTLVEDGFEIVPGVRALDAAGHTVGHMGVVVESEGQRLIHLCDCCLHALQTEHPTWTAVFDADPARVVETRRRLFKLASDADMLVFFYHFPFPGLGRLVCDGESWRWQPLTAPAGAAVERGVT